MSNLSLQDTLAKTNADFFLREFSFSRTQFQPTGGTEVELADHVVSFDDLLLLFQFKEREAATGDSEEEERWFTRKVAKKAVSQVRDTLSYLAAGPIGLANDRGHTVELPRGLAGLRVAKVIVYRPSDALPEHARRQKGYVSSSAGFIHFFQTRDYDGVLETLVTLPEIVDYLGYRERLSRRFPSETSPLSEQAMVGHYLLGDEGAIPREQYAANVFSLQNNVEEFDILGLLSLFKDRSYAMKRPDGAAESPTDYYEVLKEMVRLPREDLAAFKLRYKWAWDRCGTDSTVLPSRFASGQTGCAFVFIPLASDATAHAATALQNFTMAAKYDLKVDRCLGVAFRRDGSDRLIDWMHYVQPWEPDAELESSLTENYPFRESKIAFVPRYTFGPGGTSSR
ncbi:MAG TPA: hypothetical protein VNZ26_09990 [Vicinamibacterales bacterium]|nr:hypothetical protein [Vicinamibacterales bacterium]